MSASTHMMVLIPETCWNMCRPQPTRRARRVGGYVSMRQITGPSGSATKAQQNKKINSFQSQWELAVKNKQTNNMEETCHVQHQVV